MAREPKSAKGALPWVYSLLLHAVVLVLLFVGVGFGVNVINAPPGTGEDAQPVKATVVSQDLINQQLEQIKAAEARKKAAQEAAKRERQQQIEAARKAREAEQQRLAELKQQREAAQQAAAEAAAERKREAAAEQQRLAELKAKREAAAREAAEAKAAAEAARKKAAAAEAARKEAAEAEARRKAQAAKEAERRRKELQQELAAEEAARKKAAAEAKAAAQRSEAMGNYVAGIKQKVVRNWLVPPTTPADLKCVVNVTQIPGGTVVNAEVASCNADEAVQQSIISAVYKASPLPEPSEASLFERQIRFTFTNEDVDGQ
ncbi:MAG TPA: cell envelope integrity protein TolA [Gammaproteobacteria bacterium]|nr:cell envelope integrity protein TolA [Gammaproteobacteria bacterium]